MKHLVFGFFCSLSVALYGQVSGVITNEGGEALPYVSIYLKGTSIGTTSNLEGEYKLPTSGDTQILVFQYVGYETVQKQITSEAQVINITMKPQSTLLNEVVIAADAEDPAYAVIRKAIEKREYYNELIKNYTCDVYVKGNTKMLDAPETILGQDVGDLDGALDSNRQGIVYLSESVSELFVMDGQSKEIITSSKVSGDDNGYSWNSAQEMEFTFYENSFELERAMLSPIAENALNYYRYKLLGTYFDEEKRLINKIQVTPKRESDPCFFGEIYIVQDLWNIHSLNLNTTAKAAQIYVLDTLTFKQVYIPVEEPDRWALFNNSISFSGGLFGFKLQGVFSAIYSDYNLSPNFDENTFGSVVLEVTKESNKRDSSYWESIRPIPLTPEEKVDYIKKDSIQEVRNDPVYMDSIDRVENKFGFGDLLGGYDYRKRKRHFYLSLSSPVSNFSFNAVQGFNTGIEMRVRKYLDEQETKGIYLGGKVNYGFSEKKLRGEAYITFDPSGQTWNWWHIRGGDVIKQFQDNAISDEMNMFYSLLLKENYARFYNKKYIEVIQRQELGTGFFLRTSLEYSQRSSLENNTNYSLFRKDNFFESNGDIPTNQLDTPPGFQNHQALILDLSLTIRPGLKYGVRPDFKYSLGSSGPNIGINYTQGIPLLGGDIEFQKIAGSIRDTWDVGVGGSLNWYVNAGIFFNQERVELMDFRHFSTYEVLFTDANSYATSFLQLPYYDYSTSDKYFQVHLQHHFNGWILDKVPLFEKLGWSLVAGAKHLSVSDLPSYQEFHLGFDNIGVGVFRLIRVDGVMSLSQGESDFGVRLSVGF